MADMTLPEPMAATPGALPGEARTATAARTRLLAPAVALVLGAMALVKLLLHLAPIPFLEYDVFVDELYYLAAADHLDFGFVDFPPLFPLITAAVKATLGESLLAIRLVPALAGAGLLLMAGLLAREMGGGTFAAALAALGILAAPIFLVMHSIHTMNALDPLIWTGMAWILIRIVRTGDGRWWLLFGLLAGVGLLNKHGLAFFAVPAAAAVLLTSLRAHLRRRWIWLGAGTALLVFLPNLIWVIAHRFPHLEMLRFIRMHGRDVQLDPLEFLGQQVQMFHPLALPLWGAGLLWLLFGREGRRYRVLGLTWILLMVLMLAMDGRVYYPAPAYPMLFAAGGVALERLSRAAAWRRRLAAGWAALLAVTGALLAPLWTPLLPPETLVRYSAAIGQTQPRIENHRLGALPQLMADRFGWREMAGAVARAWHALPEEERARTAIFAQNYGQAGAIDRYGPGLGLPRAISGHLTYHAWGPRGYTGESVLVMEGNREALEGLFDHVEKVGEVRHPWSMPYQNFDLFLCRGMREPLDQIWPRLRNLG